MARWFRVPLDVQQVDVSLELFLHVLPPSPRAPCCAGLLLPTACSLKDEILRPRIDEGRHGHYHQHCEIASCPAALIITRGSALQPSHHHTGLGL